VGARLLVPAKHLNGRFGKRYGLLKRLAELGINFVIISKYKEINRWRPPPHPKYSPRQRLQS
jgi:hypothetical protein